MDVEKADGDSIPMEEKRAVDNPGFIDSTQPENWDEKPLPAMENKTYPPGESFVIPIDSPDAPYAKPRPRNDRNEKAYNTFAAKKTVAQGMMDIALLTANANQLRYLIEYNAGSATFILNVILISISILLQVAVGICLIFKGRYDMRGLSRGDRANMINNFVVVGVFIITIINVFVASFTVNAPVVPIKT